tara:strand:- start:2839 stop:4680 length:1842 start_codon:yes stop_codon:yes gene_type:complete
MNLTFLIVIPIIFLLNFYSIGKILIKKDLSEQIIFGFVVYILILNYLFFYTNISLLYIFIFFLSFSFIYFLRNFFYKKNLIPVFQFFLILIAINLLISVVAINYGSQFYVFRGNIYDTFSYLSTASIISNYNYHQILEIISNPEKKDLILSEYANFIHARPSAQIFLANLNYITNLDIFIKGFAFKSVCLLLTFTSSYSFFSNYLNKFNQRAIYSLGFVFSALFFYIYEIDAFAQLLSLPLIIIITKNLLELNKNQKTDFFLNYLLIVIYSSCFFVIYPEGAIVLSLPIGLYISHLIIMNKNILFYNKIYLFIILSLLFFIITIPLYNSTFKYLFFNQLNNGLNANNDFWGYYGAFILGKANPIYDHDVVSMIKNLWKEKASLVDIIISVKDFNIENNNQFYYLNILPSLFGFFHLTTTNNLNFLNYFYILTLIFINFVLLKIILKNLIQISRNFNNENNFYKLLIFYLLILTLYLFFSKNYWTLIKVYSFYSFFIYIFIIYDFEKKIFTNKFLIFILILFPIYKYSSFNSGIGSVDSFPSIMKKELKTKTSWLLDYKEISTCNHIKYEFNDRFKQIYLKLALDDFKIDNTNNKTFDCRIIYNNNNFEILSYE